MKYEQTSPTKTGVGKAKFHGSRAKFHHFDPIFHVKGSKFHPYFIEISWVFHASFIIEIIQKPLVFKGFSNKSVIFKTARRKQQAALKKSPFFPLVVSLFFLPLMVSVKRVSISILREVV